MRRFWIAVYTLTALSHVPFAAALAFALGLARVPFAGLVAAAVALLLTWLLRGRVRRAAADRHEPAWRLALIEEPYYVHWCATIAAWPLLALGLLAYGIAWIAGAPPRLDHPLGAVALAAYVGALVISVYGVVVRRRWVRVRTIDVSIADLGEAFDGYRVAQLSDLHIGGLWPRARAERWVRRVNRLDVDLIALTGDYVTSGTAFHHDIAAVLSAMRARDGAIAVMGNHDYFGDGEPLITLLREGGVVVLRNERHALSRGGDDLVIAGVDDTWTRRADVARALEGRDPRAPMIALAHDPMLFPELARRGAALVLSGHTHWGQIAVPFLSTRFNLSRLSYRYHAGLYRQGASTLYVHPGLGTTGPPLRVGAAPEITVLRLRRAAESD